ncbi:MAG: hypothetical protein ER33_01775 [Cyanobium sp. CACIAM 14]|nr:MAG: hypothetical protein ER33_01775 [Cyanobium sp. CACIAM 14]
MVRTRGTEASPRRERAGVLGERLDLLIRESELVPIMDQAAAHGMAAQLSQAGLLLSQLHQPPPRPRQRPQRDWRAMRQDDVPGVSVSKTDAQARSDQIPEGFSGVQILSIGAA